MLDKFLSYIKEENLFNLSDKVLIAVSGGLDSMVMADLFISAGCQIGIAHINHHLRGEESDEDARFIKEFSARQNITYFEYDIDPSIFEHGNMHATAREIRYNWLTELAEAENFHHIATGHHLDDSKETFIMHLMRGAGLDGLDGIPSKSGKIIRPLMFASREEIAYYAKKHQIPYREDSSNDEDKYLRNKIRHHVLPNIYESDERAKLGLTKSINNLHDSNLLLSFLLDEFQSTWVKVLKNGELNFDISKLPAGKLGLSVLYQTVKKYGYTMSQCQDVLSHTHPSGNRFMSSSHEAILDRNKFIIRTHQTNTALLSNIEVRPPCLIDTGKQVLRFEVLDNHETIIYERGKLFLDFDRLAFPLHIRKKQVGDIIAPLGMQGRTQKIKDYLINKKVSQFDKEMTWLLEDQSGIQSVLFLGISDHVKISETTQLVLKISVATDIG